MSARTLKGHHTTVVAHMPTAHREYAAWTPAAPRALGRADRPGHRRGGRRDPRAARVHPEQGFRACLGLLRLGERYGAERLEAACRRAQQLGACRYQQRRIDPAAAVSIASPCRNNPRLDLPHSRTTMCAGPRYFH